MQHGWISEDVPKWIYIVDVLKSGIYSRDIRRRRLTSDMTTQRTCETILQNENKQARRNTNDKQQQNKDKV